ncbi:class I tRNA ligase family protein [Mycoplasmopsis cynos]|uniref:class I tRNA ligase family protein n=1 Tax=Mycoplasmopsis cynos TaxID=171284 RepID=UPI0030D180A2
MLKIYVCGPTVYNFVHIGNLRPIITYDLMLKAARILDVDFKFIHNITDIDDKIIIQAAKEHISEKELATKYANDYLDVLKKFNVDTITNYEYVTKNIDQIILIIHKMLATNDAYQVNGNVWFNTQKNLEYYGRTSGQKVENMSFEETTFEKRHKADFALWKSTSSGIKYNSPFGPGRPGWHTECVALIYKHFQEQGLDLHGGGMDLTFPHHENENVQFYSLFYKDLAKRWLRTGQINLNNQKMSKSLNNVFMAKDFLKVYSPDHLKLIFLLNNITSIINIDDNLINNVEIMLTRIRKIYFLSHLLNDQNTKYNDGEFLSIIKHIYELRFSDFIKAVNDLIKEINASKNVESINLLKKIFDSLGFEFNKFDFSNYVAIYNEWKDYLVKKDYFNADKIREILIKEKLI